MSRLRAAVVGAAGYTGGELLRLLLDHPHIEVVAATSERLDGEYLHHTHPHLRRRTLLRFTRREALPDCDVVFGALPHGESAQIIDELRSHAPLLIDLSADFRLRNAGAYETWYGWSHPRPELLDEAVYALPEIDRARIAEGTLLSTGGCVATASILGLLPLARAGVIDSDAPLIIDAKIGSSAAGAQPGAASHHPHRRDQMRSFAPTGHRHTAEIEQETGLGVWLSVTAVEAVRGVLATAHVTLRDDVEERDIWRIFRGAYGSEPFVRIVKERTGIHRVPEPRLLAGTNIAEVGFERDPHSRRVVVMSAIDNLCKGAAGQAVHALNIARGFDECDGLGFGGLYP